MKKDKLFTLGQAGVGMNYNAKMAITSKAMRYDKPLEATQCLDDFLSESQTDVISVSVSSHKSINPFEIANEFDYKRELNIITEDMSKNKPVPFYGNLHLWLLSKLRDYMLMPDFWDKAQRYEKSDCFHEVYRIVVYEDYQPSLEFVLQNHVKHRSLLAAMLLYDLNFPDEKTVYPLLGGNYIYEWDSYKKNLIENKYREIMPYSDFQKCAKTIIQRIDIMCEFDLITGDEYNLVRHYINVIKTMQYGISKEIL